MTFAADLHLHSHFSRATSKDSCLEEYWREAQLKGISLLGTGDFTFPAWNTELHDKLQQDDDGLFQFKPDALPRTLNIPPACRNTVRFLLTSEISCIYKRDGRTRKNHSVIIAPDFKAMDKISAALDAVGNIKSDGRPILGIDCRDLLSIVLEADAALIPAHIWTPWFSMLGSKSGFDSPEECFGDLATEIFAVETGLSSDIPMNQLVSCLDRLTLISSSDAHSAPSLARNATLFDGQPSFDALLDALKTGHGFAGTIDMYPEEGKYHLDGHRACNVCLTPDESTSFNNLCPVCGKPLVLGVLHRVLELADRKPDAKPAHERPFCYIIPLHELLGEIHGTSAASKSVCKHYDSIVAEYGPELHILLNLEPGALRRHEPLLAEAITRLRAGAVMRRGGYDGKFGHVTVFKPGELDMLRR